MSKCSLHTNAKVKPTFCSRCREDRESARDFSSNAKPFISNLMSDFEQFVSDSIDDGYAEQFDDHFDFLRECMVVWTELKNEEGE